MLSLLCTELIYTHSAGFERKSLFAARPRNARVASSHSLRMPPTGKCPVDHAALARAQNAPTSAFSRNGRATEADAAMHHSMSRARPSSTAAHASPQSAGGCPVDHSATPDPRTQASGGCPVDHTALQSSEASANSSRVGDSAPEQIAAQKPVCPFGFTSEASSMTSLHCPRCRSLFYDCTQTSCGHHFCRECIRASPDCLKCGETISGLQPEEHVQGLVDTFIETHSGDETFLDGKPIMSEVDGESKKDAEATRATFMLEVGLRSFAGGNFAAASARLELCREVLLRMLEARGASPELSTRLGAVCGSQGDCSLQLGDPQAAVRNYEASVRHLEESTVKSPEVQQALSVTQNKLGDLWYRVGNLSSARELYKRALEIRKAAAQAAKGEQRLGAELDLAMSLAKMADIQSALGDNGAHDQAMDEARELARGLDGSKAELQPPQQKRLAAVQAFLQTSNSAA